MTRIFQPILSQALIYIDDILLFFPNLHDHLALLTQFHYILQQYGIILSIKKMSLAVTTIDFLGLTISNGQISLQPHIAQELLKFPDRNLTHTQV